MAKVYEALRRAGQNRGSRLAGPPAPEPVPSLEPSLERPAVCEPGPLRRELPDTDDEPSRAGPGALTTDKRRIALLEPESFVAEQFRVLRSRLDSLAGESPLKTLVVTSARSGEGKSSVATNLALVLAMGVARKVILIDCDMRRPAVLRSLGLDPDVGLAEVLLERARPEQATRTLEGTSLEVLGVRMQPPNPSELLACPRMRELLVELREDHDWVILDTPATLGLSDSKIVGELCDGYLMVVRAGETLRADVEAAIDVLGPRSVVGLVLNGAQMGRERYAYS